MDSDMKSFTIRLYRGKGLCKPPNGMIVNKWRTSGAQPGRQHQYIAAPMAGLFDTILHDKALHHCIRLYLVSRIALFVIGYAGIREMKLHDVSKPAAFIVHTNPLISMWGSFDSGAYVRIAENGYPSSGSGETELGLYNFFPLYPLMMKGLSAITSLHVAVSGLIISNLALLVAAFYLFRLVSQVTDNRTARISVLMLYIYPASFFLSGIYTEALFLMLVVLAFYHAHNGSWLQSGIAAALLTACRPTGVTVILPLLLLYFSRPPSQRKASGIIYIGLSALGIGGYMLFNYLQMHDPMFFMTNPAWSREFRNPFSMAYNAVTQEFFTYRFLGWWLIALLACWLFYMKSIPLHFNILLLLLLLVPAAYTLDSVPRMSVVAFPMYAGFAIVAQRYNCLSAVIFCFALLQGYMAVCWFAGFGNAV